MSLPRGHQRAHLRAPFREPVLYASEGFVHKARARNVSEGGLLLDQVPHLPAEDEVALMLALPQFPHFRHFDLQRLREFSRDLFPAKVIRLHCQMARRTGETTSVDEVFRPGMGVRFMGDIGPQQKLIAEYVETFTANLAFLQVLMDSWTTNEETREHALELARVLGYGETKKVAELRAQVTRDYVSLQWL